jgi:hypothetical protein
MNRANETSTTKTRTLSTITNPNIPFSFNMSQLFRAAQRNDLVGVRRELDAGNSTPNEFALALRVACRNDCVALALRVACRNDCAAVVQYMWPLCQDKDKGALHYLACQSGSTRVIRHILTGLVPASASGRSDVVRCLLANKANAHLEGLANNPVWVNNPLHHAIYFGNARVVLILLQANASLNACIGFRGEPALAFAQSQARGSADRPNSALFQSIHMRYTSVVRLLKRALNARQDARC